MRLTQPIFVKTVSTLLAAAALTGIAPAQYAKASSNPAPPVLLRAELRSGDVLRYELEGSVSFLPQAEAGGVSTRGPCDYSLAAIVTLRAEAADKDGNTPVEATYSSVRVTSVRCEPLSLPDFEKRVASLEKTPTIFRVGPHGETGLIRFGEKYFNYWNGGDLMRKITLDLLQTELSVKPVSPGATWKPRGQFAYSQDFGLHDLDLSAADIKFKNVVQVNGDSCAWITSKYVFSPLDIAASATTREGRVPQYRTNNAVAATLELSLLLDTANHHVAWVHRSQSVDNRLSLADPSDQPSQTYDYPSAQNPHSEMDAPESENPVPDVELGRPGARRHPLVSFHFHEEARARLLKADTSLEWLSALRTFEQSPEPESNTTGSRVVVPGPFTAATKPSVKKATRVVDSDSLVATPAGFTRYEKALCRDALFCATASMALPGRVTVTDDTPLQSVYLAHRDGLTISVTLGPALDRKYPGLNEDEELQKHASYYLSNYIWMAAKPGIGTSFSSATLDGYPGMLAEFSSTQRDMAKVRGMLGLVLTPWGKVVPVSCASDQEWTAQAKELCEQVITSVTLRR